MGDIEVSSMGEPDEKWENQKEKYYIYKGLYKIDNMVGGIWVNSLMWSLSALRTLPHTGLIWWLGTDVSKIMFYVPICRCFYDHDS